jgi:hypothetical protein
MKRLVGMMGVAMGAVWGLNGSAWSEQKDQGKDTEAEGFKMTCHLTGGVAPYRFVAVTGSSRAGQESVRCTA